MLCHGASATPTRLAAPVAAAPAPGGGSGVRAAAAAPTHSGGQSAPVPRLAPNGRFLQRGAHHAPPLKLKQRRARIYFLFYIQRHLSRSIFLQARTGLRCERRVKRGCMFENKELKKNKSFSEKTAQNCQQGFREAGLKVVPELLVLFVLYLNFSKDVYLKVKNVAKGGDIYNINVRLLKIFERRICRYFLAYI